MKCPYRVATIFSESISNYHDEDSNLAQQEDLNMRLPVFLNCLEKECAVYEDGRCRFKQ